MKNGDVMYLAVYRNGESSVYTEWESARNLTQAWFFVKQTYKYVYQYGSHCEFQIIDNNGNPTVLSVNNFEVLKFQTTGTEASFKLVVEFKDCRNANLYKHTLSAYQEDLIKAVIELLNDITKLDSYETYKLRQENDYLKSEIKRLNNEIKITNKQIIKYY